jgi:hypothetical protein
VLHLRHIGFLAAQFRHLHQPPDLSATCSPPVYRPTDLLAASVQELAVDLLICLPPASLSACRRPPQGTPWRCVTDQNNAFRHLWRLAHPHLDLLFYRLLITYKICSDFSSSCQTLHFTVCSSVCFGLQSNGSFLHLLDWLVQREKGSSD